MSRFTYVTCERCKRLTTGSLRYGSPRVNMFVGKIVVFYSLVFVGKREGELKNVL